MLSCQLSCHNKSERQRLLLRQRQDSDICTTDCEATSSRCSADIIRNKVARRVRVALRVYPDMFQWQERQQVSRTGRTRVEGNTATQTTYSYANNWSTSLHDSALFSNADDYYNPHALGQ